MSAIERLLPPFLEHKKNIKNYIYSKNWIMMEVPASSNSILEKQYFLSILMLESENNLLFFLFILYIYIIQQLHYIF